ncbi:MAG: hypothetical protein Q8S73_03550 [Deltaproteobacteria bacterium]|nr:hypothetical protein [Myxococcales bacterium]MDP3213154.1 hypothetical protein [Deltaproteobacteria bacterium]
MEKQTTRGPNVNLDADRPARPQWWNDNHTSTWDRVKEALRRDWEQTKNDFSSESGADLNQDVGDTVKQATGAEPLPPPMVKTHPDDPMDAAKLIEKQIKEQGKVQKTIAEVKTEVAVEQVRAQGKIASESQNAQEKIASEQRKLVEMRQKAGEKIAEVQQKAGEKIAEVQQEAGEKIADWNRVEPAVRYGYGARLQYVDVVGWDDQLEGRLNHEWTQLRNGTTWEDARPHVRRGWDAANRNSLV